MPEKAYLKVKNCPICTHIHRKRIEKYLLKGTYDYDMYDRKHDYKDGSTRHHMRIHIGQAIKKGISEEIIEDKINAVNSLENRVKRLEEEFNDAEKAYRDEIKINDTFDTKSLRYVRNMMREAEQSYYKAVRLLEELRGKLGANYYVNLTADAKVFKDIVQKVLVANDLFDIWKKIKQEVETSS